MADLNRRALLGSVAAAAVTAAAGIRRAPGLAYATFESIPLERFGVDLASEPDSYALSQVNWATDGLSPGGVKLMKLWRDGRLIFDATEPAEGHVDAEAAHTLAGIVT